jgi:uncharacterized protein YerC
MVRTASEEDRRQVIDLWFQGHSYREMGEDVGIAISTISSIIQGARDRTYDLDDLRRLNVRPSIMPCRSSGNRN